jgi:hypothetical protein
MTPEMMLAIASVITSLLVGLGAFIGIFIGAKERREQFLRIAKKDEVQLLQSEVDRLQKRVELLEGDYERVRRNNVVLLDYIALLRGLMVAAGIKVPTMPTLE